MRKSITAIAAVGLAAAFCAAPVLKAHAGDGPYLAAGYGISAYETKCNGDACDRRDSGFKVAAGWRFMKAWSVEALYLNPGGFVASDVTPGGAPFHGRAHVHAVGGYAGYDYYFSDAFSLGARVGAASVKGEFTPGPAPAIAGGKTTTQFLGGLNAGWHVTDAWSVRLDWDHTRARMNRYDGDVNLVSVGVQFGF